MRTFLMVAAFCALSSFAEANGPAVYSPTGIEIGVIVRTNPDGSFVVLPLASAGLGAAPITVNPALLRRRPDGNWTAFLDFGPGR